MRPHKRQANEELDENIMKSDLKEMRKLVSVLVKSMETNTANTSLMMRTLIAQQSDAAKTSTPLATMRPGSIFRYFDNAPVTPETNTSVKPKNVTKDDPKIKNEEKHEFKTKAKDDEKEHALRNYAEV